MTMELTDTAGMPTPAAAQLAAVRTELEQQRSFRVEQIEEVETDAAEAGRCGFTHLDSGRVCLRPHRHPGSCHLQRTVVTPAPASSMRLP